MFQPLDLVLVFDTSGSVGAQAFAEQKAAAVDLVGRIDLAQVRVAALLIGTRASILFDFDDLRTVSELQAAIAAVRFVPLQTAAARVALDVTRGVLLSEVAGYRGGGAVVLWMSDGITSDDDEAINFAATRLRAELPVRVVTASTDALGRPDAGQLPLLASAAEDMLVLRDMRDDPTLFLVHALCVAPGSTVAPTTTTTGSFALCPLRRDLDLVFVIDASGSVSAGTFYAQLNMAVSLVGILAIPPVRVGVVLIQSAAQTALFFDHEFFFSLKKGGKKRKKKKKKKKKKEKKKEKKFKQDNKPIGQPNTKQRMIAREEEEE